MGGAVLVATAGLALWFRENGPVSSLVFRRDGSG